MTRITVVAAITLPTVFLALLRISAAEKEPGEAERKCKPTEAADVTFIVISQDSLHHSTLAYRLKASILSQAASLGGQPPQIYIIPEDIKTAGAWTLLQLFPLIHNVNNGTWVLFCKEATQVFLKQLLSVLTRHGCFGEKWLGYPMLDRRPTPIHHYAPSAFPYPLSVAGFAVSVMLLHRMSRADYSKRSIFTTDPYYEMAETIYYTTNIQLTGESTFCFKYNRKCSTAPLEGVQCEQVVRGEIFFAIKTYKDNHETRAQVLKDTWLRNAANYLFFSDFYDASLPAVDTGVTNTLVGHCHKTLTILNYLDEALCCANHNKFKWIILTDDDTILSVSEMEKNLACFNNEMEPLIIGERYGYGYGQGRRGYDYITGGGGVAMNRAAVAKLASCECASADSPDDMWLGACARQNSVKIIHNEAFHQARPGDYATEYLEWIKPVSFHKFDPADPYYTFNKWFKENNLNTLDYRMPCKNNNNSNMSRDEL